MAENSNIAWTDHTFNPWWGCQEVAGHPGCAHCYAREFSRAVGRAKWGADGKGTRVVTSNDTWKSVLKWQKAAATANRIDSVFCASMSDLFEDWGDGPVLDHHKERLSDGEEWETLGAIRRRVFDLWPKTPNLRWLTLTKRPENVRMFWPYDFDPQDLTGFRTIPWTCKNVWVGTSISDQKTADEWIERLSQQFLRGICAGTFCSAEPLTGPIKLKRSQWKALDWIIVGGESGRGARPCSLAWIQSLIDDALRYGVPVFMKQTGDNVVEYEPKADKGGDPAEWPEAMRVRQFPWSKAVL